MPQSSSSGWQVTADAGDDLAYAILSQDSIWNCFALADLNLHYASTANLPSLLETATRTVPSVLSCAIRSSEKSSPLLDPMRA